MKDSLFTYEVGKEVYAKKDPTHGREFGIHFFTEKQKAIDYVNDYLKYCKYKGRTIKDTSSYLHQKGFDEDWLATPECYVVKDGDDANLVKFKTYMVQNHQPKKYG